MPARQTTVAPVSATRGSPEFSDYVLLGKNGKPLAVVVAKKSSKEAELGREQAKQYCQNIQAQYGCELPFCFYTNGHEIFFWNLDEAPPQKVHGFPTRQDLERLLYIRKRKKPLSDELISTTIADRDFELQAIRSVMEGIERSRSRFLLVMATGTVKTRTCIALVDALMRAGHVHLRGLFWLSKDLFEDEFQNVTEPDAAFLNKIRNYLEHKYLQLHLEMAPAAQQQLGYSMNKTDFEARTLRLLRLARGALIYLSLAVRSEERCRHDGSKLVMPMPLNVWDDEWKR